MTRTETIKRELRAAGVPQWKLAAEVGVSENTLGRWFRREISQEKFEELHQVISVLWEGGEDEQSKSDNKETV